MEPITSLTDTTANVATSAAKEDAASGLTSDFDTFLTLLTAQIRNQDPLEPENSTEFVAQLATFSNVEQTIQTNTLLESMTAQLDRQSVSAAADWIGKEVRHDGAVAVSAGSGPTQLHLSMPAIADAAELVAYDASGNEVARQAVSTSATTYDWSGDGLADGSYAIVLEASAGDQVLQTGAVLHYDTVREVTLGDAGVDLVTADGVTVSTSRVDSVRSL